MSQQEQARSAGTQKPTYPRNPEQVARHQAIRERFQREKPSLEQLVASGEYTEPISMGEYLSIRQAVIALRKARERAGLSLAEVAERMNSDAETLAKMETGLGPLPTLSLLIGYAAALGKRWVWVLDDVADDEAAVR